MDKAQELTQMSHRGSFQGYEKGVKRRFAMENNTYKSVKLALLVLTGIFLFASALPAKVLAGSSREKVNTDRLGIAIKGYDPVAYFTAGRPVKGSREFEYEWQDAKWHFSSAANRDKFVANPQAYAPQYGGF